MSIACVAETDDGREGDPVVDGAVDHEGVDDVAQLRLQLEYSEVKEEDGYLDEVVGCWAGSEGGHDPLKGEVSSLRFGGVLGLINRPRGSEENM